MTGTFRVFFAWAVIALVFPPAAAQAADKAVDPCSYLTAAEIQSVLGAPVKAGTAKVEANPYAGSSCTYVVNDFGSLNILVKPLQSGETPAIYRAQFAKMKMPPTDVPGLGDAAYFTSPGYEMVQLHAFKAGKYILITFMDPARKEAAARPLAVKLMRTAVARIK
jgi:hypothetical protein